MQVQVQAQVQSRTGQGKYTITMCMTQPAVYIHTYKLRTYRICTFTLPYSSTK